jgi:hypothetical protein
LTPQLQISYAQPIRWYRQRRFQRWVILLAILLLGWTIAREIPPFWHRYRCWQLNDRATRFPTTPDQILLDYSPPGPPLPHVATNVVQFQSELWASRSNAGLGTLTSPMLTGTPLLCHLLKTSKGSSRVVQIYAQISGLPSGITTVSFLAASCAIPDRRWILSPPKNGINRAFASTDFATAQLQFRALTNLTLNGGAVDPADPSVAEIKFGLNAGSYVIRIHLGDNFDQGPYPRMAIEIPQSLVGAKDSAGWMSSGFYSWPIATAPHGN